eukprot:GILI01010916.1.p1 GENE.GILI01010916.1~~GILI01010916.1.p1  ORF type:complete len:860 (-),score=165.77 GILI01010916.1:52-2400(-)
MTQSVFLRQFGNTKRPSATKVPIPSSPSTDLTLGPTESLVVMEDALRLTGQLHSAVTSEKAFENRPVVAFAMHVIGAIVLAGSASAAIGHVARVGEGDATKKLISTLTITLCAALSNLQQLDLLMKKAGYKQLLNDPSRSISGDFAIIRGLEHVIQSNLLVVDFAIMRQQPVLKPAPSRPVSWDDLPNSYVGQKAILSTISKHFKARDRGVIDDNKPTVLLFFGPSGHGKSELAKSIAKVLHPSEPDVEGSGKLVMIHLPSFCTKDSIYSLVDPPAAHVGEGMLLSALRKEPSAVVVLDEFEKSTADSIQNLWLSVFQKDGMLRSLKDATRSTSTTKATFVLTCNLCDDLITSSEREYLASSPSAQEAMRQEYARQCKEVVRQQLGEPFLNRVDFFLPFVPYSVEEKKDFTALQLSYIALQQYKKYHRLFVATPSYLAAIATNTRNFHTSSVSQHAQEVLMQYPEPEIDPLSRALLNQHAMTRVAHSWARVDSTNYSPDRLYYGAFLGNSAVGSMDWAEMKARLQATLTGDNNAQLVEAMLEAAVNKQIDTFVPKSTSQTVSPLSSQSESAMATSSPPNPAGSPPSSAEPPAQARAATGVYTDPMSMTSSNANAQASTLRRRGTNNEEKESQMLLQTQTILSTDTTKDTDRETLVETQKEVTKLRELLLVKDKEIAYLKETVKQLSTLVAVLLVFAMASMLLLALVVGLKVAVSMVLLCGLVLYLLVDNLFKLLWLAVKALYGFLGPVKFGALAAGLLSYIVYVAQQVPPPCPAMPSATFTN